MKEDGISEGGRTEIDEFEQVISLAEDERPIQQFVENHQCLLTALSMLPNVSINGRIRSSGQFGRWWYSISPCRNNECVRRLTVFAFNQRS